MNSCANCDREIKGSYCENCGQRTSVGRITFRETTMDIFDTFLAPNGPLLLTFKSLFRYPGILFREFLSGKRRKYYKPVSFFLVTTVLYLLVRWALDFDPLVIGPQAGDLDQSIIRDIYAAGRFMFTNINKLLIFLVFTLAVFLKLFFPRLYSFAEYLTIAFYLAGVYTVVTIANMFVVTFLLPGLHYLAVAIMLLYFVYAMISWIAGNAVWIAFKSLLVWILAVLFYMVMAFVFSYMVILIQTG